MSSKTIYFKTASNTREYCCRIVFFFHCFLVITVPKLRIFFLRISFVNVIHPWTWNLDIKNLKKFRAQVVSYWHIRWNMHICALSKHYCIKANVNNFGRNFNRPYKLKKTLKKRCQISTKTFILWPNHLRFHFGTFTFLRRTNIEHFGKFILFKIKIKDEKMLQISYSYNFSKIIFLNLKVELLIWNN